MPKFCFAVLILTGVLLLAGEAQSCQTNEDCYDGNDCTADVCLIFVCSNEPIGGMPCEDQIFCNGEDICSWGGVCEHSGDPCGDNGQFCDGDEFCDPELDQCASAGDPCDPATQTCNETDDVCDGDPCQPGQLCIRVCLNGLWDGSEHTLATKVTVDLYLDPDTLVRRIDQVSLQADGRAVVDLAANGVADGSYFVVIRHFGFLALISEAPVYLDDDRSNPLDFTDPANVEGGQASLASDNGSWCMPSGDLDGDGRVALPDFLILRNAWNKQSQAPAP